MQLRYSKNKRDIKRKLKYREEGQCVSLITEGDIYRLAAKSELPGAEKFEAWIFDEVLPSIRKNGMYATDELLDNPDLLIAAATKLKEERKARLEAEKKVKVLEQKYTPIKKA